MIQNVPREIHVPSAGYLRRFNDGRSIVTVHDIATGAQDDRGVAKAGSRLDWWGADPAVAEAMESSMTRCEDRALRALRKLDRVWPLEGEHRAMLAEFIVLHIVRTPAFRVFLRSVSEEAINSGEFRSRVKSEDRAQATRHFRGDRMHAATLLGQIGRIASLLCGMHWSLIRFDDDLLATSDQPVVILPLIRPRSGVHSAASVIPPDGYMETIEIRLSLDPKTLLLMSWASGEDRLEPLLGTFNQACNANCAVTAQADKEWFSKPGKHAPRLTPPTLQPLVYPVSPELIVGYDVAVASRSLRRQIASEDMQRMIRDSTDRDRIHWAQARRSVAT